jgi:cysteinyl-tRNA synthetase
MTQPTPASQPSSEALPSHRSLLLHDSLAGRRRVFEPQDPNRVTVYVCGPTVYNFVHIGNGRPAVVFDVLVRLLRRLYPHVVYARNVTDVDDKINAAAREAGESIADLTERFVAAYNEDVAALGVLEADVEPRATHHIAEIIDMIGRLIERGHAYAADGHVLFHVPSDPDYGALSHRDLEDMLAGARIDVEDYKRHPGDFVLWKPSTPELPGWDSPWGRGRPGWHIECSAMIEKHLGASIDIHGGGSDLIFPHHENERAQSTCAHGSPDYVRYWLHNGMLTTRGAKMAKSEGNFVTIRALRERVDGEALRYALLSGHYRSPLEWEQRLLDQATTSLDRLYGALRGPVATDAAAISPSVLEALLDDLNTPQALAGLHELASEVNRAGDEATAATARARLRASAELLGLLQRPADDWFKASRAGDGPSDAEIEAAIAERAAARKAKDFATADRVRKALLEQGVELEDTPAGTRWQRTR